MDLSSWLGEMKRRRVFRALLGYGVVAFAVLQVVEPVMHGLDLPEWVLKATVVALGLGFPFTLVLAWAFDVRGGRIEKAGPPRGEWLVLLLVVGLALGAPGVAWVFLRSQRPAAPAPGTASIAVLPFADLSPGKDQDWMCDGIAEEILDALCTVNGLRVAARSSAFRFKGKQVDVREMATTLGVATLLEGSVRKVGDRLRVSARLVSSEGYELWSDKFDRGVEDAFAIQEEIARSVVAALRLQMHPEQARRGPSNAQAWEMYLRGRQYVASLGMQNIELGMQMFRRAIALDPDFAQAHAGLADGGSTLAQWLLLPKAELPALRATTLAESETALRLDPALGEAHLARGNMLAMLGRSDEAERSFRRAIELAPGARDNWYHYARFLFSAGRYADSARAYEEAARIDPDDYDALNLLAMPLSKLGDSAKVADAHRRSLAAADRALKEKPDNVRALYLSAGSLVQLGQVAKGLERMDQAVALAPHDFAILYNATCAYARAGETEKALDLLDRAVGTGQGYRAWMENDPDLDSIRRAPRFQQIIARLPH